jgi:hypothetical protein
MHGLGRKRFGGGFASFVGRRTVGFCVAMAALLPSGGWAEGLRGAEARNVTLGIYADDSLAKVAVLKVARVFSENRRLGFYRIKLLPLLVAQGVRLEFAESTPNTNWVTAFLANCAPLARPGSCPEWRDVSVRFPQDAHPRLEASRLRPPTGAGEESCLLENVTIQTAAGALSVPRARLLFRGQVGRVVWESQGAVQQWDLFTCRLTSEKSGS